MNKWLYPSSEVPDLVALAFHAILGALNVVVDAFHVVVDASNSVVVARDLVDLSFGEVVAADHDVAGALEQVVIAFGLVVPSVKSVVSSPSHVVVALSEIALSLGDILISKNAVGITDENILGSLHSVAIAMNLILVTRGFVGLSDDQILHTEHQICSTFHSIDVSFDVIITAVHTVFHTVDVVVETESPIGVTVDMVMLSLGDIEVTIKVVPLSKSDVVSTLQSISLANSDIIDPNLSVLDADSEVVASQDPVILIEGLIIVSFNVVSSTHGNIPSTSSSVLVTVSDIVLAVEIVVSALGLVVGTFQDVILASSRILLSEDSVAPSVCQILLTSNSILLSLDPVFVAGNFIVPAGHLVILALDNVQLVGRDILTVEIEAALFFGECPNAQSCYRNKQKLHPYVNINWLVGPHQNRGIFDLFHGAAAAKSQAPPSLKGAVGVAQHCIIYRKMEKKKATVESYPVIRMLGKGTFGEVYLSRNAKGEFAVKKIAKDQLIKSRKLYQPYIQKEVLSRLSHPGIIRVYDTFSDGESIYLVLELCFMGQLTRFLKSGLMKENTRRHYFAQMVAILEHLKEKRVTHRDFKSSNLLVTTDGHLKLTDFGCAYAPSEFLGEEAYDRILNIKKMSEQQNVQHEGERRATFVGTPFYMSPEILKDSVCNFQADLWALGCLLYEVYIGRPPFVDADEYTVFKKIQQEPVSFPEDVKLEPAVHNLISGLLEKDKSKRLGCGLPDGPNSFQTALMKHPYFDGIDFEGLFERVVPGFDELASAITTVQKESPGVKKRQNRYLISGIVQKKMFLGNYKQRQMALLSDPKLIYFDEQTGQKKGEIDLDINTPIELDGHKFTVTGKKKKYYFKAKKEEHLHSASQWVNKIKEAISKAYY